MEKRYGKTGPRSAEADSWLQRLVRLMAEEPTLQGFLTRVATEREVLDEVRERVRAGALSGGRLTDGCVGLCRRLGVPESVFQSRVRAMTSLFHLGSTEPESPYAVLGVDPGADKKTIKKAFRRLSLRWHPDLNQGDPESVRRFRRIKDAYDTLSTLSLRSSREMPAVGPVWDKAEAAEVPSIGRGPWRRLGALWPLAIVTGFLVVVVGMMDQAVAPRKPFISDSTVPGTPPPVSVTGPATRQLEAPDSGVLTGRSPEDRAPAAEPVPTAAKESGQGRSASERGVPAEPSSGPLSREEVQVAVLSEVDTGRPEEPPAPVESRSVGRLSGASAQRHEPRPKRAAPSRERKGRRQKEAPVAKSLDPSGHEVRKPEPAPAGVPSAKSLKTPSAPWLGDGAVVPSEAERTTGVYKMEGPLKDFLRAYIRDYEQRNLTAFLGHFTPDAVENGRPLSEWLDTYRKNFTTIPVIHYRIHPTDWRTSTQGLRMEGEFDLKATFRDGHRLSSRGIITLDLVPYNGTYRVRRLRYRFLQSG